MATLSFEIAGSQIDGARDYQEDAFLVTRLADGDPEHAASMVIVADGMGGHAAGNVASNMAVQTFNRHVSKHFPSDTPHAVLAEAVLQANASIKATVAETAALKGMGCTLVGCVLGRDGLRWASVGDSHLYLLRDGTLTKHNADHSYGGFLDRMAAAGTPVEAESGFSRNMLMSALTGDDIAEVDCPEAPLPLRGGDRVIVASDGLDTLAPETIIEICAGAPGAKPCVDALLHGVDAAGAPRQDNTTVVVVDVTERTEAAPVTPAPTMSLVEDEQVSAPPPPPRAHPFPVEDAPAPSRAPLIVGVLLVLLAVAGGAWWFLGMQSAVPPAATDHTPVEAAEEGVGDAVATDETAVTDAASALDTAPAPAPAAAAPVAPPRRGEFRDGLRSGGQGPRMTWLPGGRFTMGGFLPTDDPSEFPQHEVTVAPFAMSVHEITLADYRRYARATGTRMPDVQATAGTDDANFPMSFVSWNDALAYVQWLARETGHEYALPSEAQWEFAARGGTTTPYYWGRQLGRANAHCFACDTGLDPRQPTAVGRFPANPFGLHDMAGNLQEWVYDCYHPNYDGAPRDGSVFEGGDCTVRVLRGGGYASGPGGLRSSARDKLRADRGNDQTGIRVVRLR